MRIIYVAGALSAATPEQTMINRIKAISFANKMRRDGYAVICPHEHDFINSDVMNEAMWIEHGLALLERCDECHVVGNWIKSKGTTIEVSFCREKNIPLYFHL